VFNLNLALINNCDRTTSRMRGFSPTTHGDLLAALRYTMPTRPLLDLSVVGWHTESFGTLYSVIVQILIRWCRANHLLQAGPLPQKILMDELPGSLSRTCSCPGAGGAMDVLPHDMLHSA
jgi:hypothetical protein